MVGIWNLKSGVSSSEFDVSCLVFRVLYANFILWSLAFGRMSLGFGL